MPRTKHIHTGVWIAWLIVLAVFVFSILPGCASKTIDQWADRGLVGIEYDRANWTAMKDLAVAELTKAQDADVEMALQDVADAAAGRLLGANGQPIQPDDQWIAEQVSGLRLLLNLHARNRRQIEQQFAAAAANLDQVGESMRQIKRLRARSIGADSEQLAAQIAQLTQLIQTLVKDRQPTPANP